MLQRLLEADDYLRDHPADALILTISALDEEADILYTTDTTLLFSKRISETMNEIRKERGFKPLKIRPPPGKSQHGSH